MSKQQILDVCTLAAHLAQQPEKCNECNGTCVAISDIDGGEAECGNCCGAGNVLHDAARCAADAMKLQRLGRSAMNALDRLSASEAGRSLHAYTQEDLDWAWQIVINKATEILAPYGLKAECRDEPFKPECLFILGLPGNTGGEGFRI